MRSTTCSARPPGPRSSSSTRGRWSLTTRASSRCRRRSCRRARSPWPRRRSAFGAVGWLLVLSERLPLEQALTAVDGWGGDSYVAYERDGVSCVKANYRGDTPEDLAQMQDRAPGLGGQGPEGGGQCHERGPDPGLHLLRPGQDAAKVGDREVDGRAHAGAQPDLPLARRWSRAVRRPGRALRRGSAGAGLHRRRAQQPEARSSGGCRRRSLPCRGARPDARTGPRHTSRPACWFTAVPCVTMAAQLHLCRSYDVRSSARARWGRRSSRRGRRRR